MRKEAASLSPGLRIGLVTLVLGVAVPGPVQAGADPQAPAAAEDDAGDAVADKSSSRKGASKKKGGGGSSASKPAPSGPDAKPAPRPGSGDNARAPSPVQPRAATPPGQPLRTTPGQAVRGAPERSPAQSTSAARRAAVRPAAPLADARRPYQPGPPKAAPLPPWRRPDHRYARPDWRHLRPHPGAHAPPPPHWHYRPWYSHWWVHPYWRYTHAAWVVVHFDFVVHAWAQWWVPPPRAGWVWVPGYWAWGYWHPGYWRPVAPPPVRAGVTYVYVPGWWQGDLYIEGWWRPVTRSDGEWTWVEGYYLEDGTWVPGHWRPAGHSPEGYIWEPGFFDGETWVDGFWRPEFYAGFVWVSRAFDEDGVYHAGYWEPIEDRPGQVWIPGWFDGTQWVQGYWVDEAEYQSADPQNWQPEEGWDDGWEEPEAPVEGAPELPLALPVEVGTEG
ncbi:hypothetical protein L6R53_28205 [Myxococcota bacterium]|nr:hypothetical protein [Myxococcota bacterium]